MMKYTKTSKISEIRTEKDVPEVVRIVRSSEVTTPHKNPIPMIKPFACESRLFLYIKKNIKIIPIAAPVVTIGRIDLRMSVFGAIKIMAEINPIKTTIMNSRIRLNFSEVISLWYALNRVIKTSKPKYKSGNMFKMMTK